MIHQGMLGEGLLRAHVTESPNQISGHGQACLTVAMSHPEIGDPKPRPFPLRSNGSKGFNDKVGRLDITVDHAELMGMFQRLGGLSTKNGHRAKEGRRSRMENRGWRIS